MTFCSEVGNYRPELLIVIEEKLFTWREERWFKTATFFFFLIWQTDFVLLGLEMNAQTLGVFYEIEGVTLEDPSFWF